MDTRRTLDGQGMHRGQTPDGQPGVRCCSPATLAASGVIVSLVTAVVTVTIVVLAGPGCQRRSSSSKDCAQYGCWSGAGRAGGAHLDKRRIQEELRALPVAPGELERAWEQGIEGQDIGNNFRLPEGRVRWDFGQELFPGRVGRAGTGAQSSCGCPWIPGMSKARLDIGVGAPGTVGGWKGMSFKIPPNPTHSRIL